jgi:hypothetical protein
MGGPLLLPTALTVKAHRDILKVTFVKGLHRELQQQVITLAPIFSHTNSKKPRKDILGMVKSASWKHLGLLWIWKYHGYLRMLLLVVALFRLSLPALP